MGLNDGFPGYSIRVEFLGSSAWMSSGSDGGGGGPNKNVFEEVLRVGRAQGRSRRLLWLQQRVGRVRRKGVRLRGGRLCRAWKGCTGELCEVYASFAAGYRGDCGRGLRPGAVRASG